MSSKCSKLGKMVCSLSWCIGYATVPMVPNCVEEKTWKALPYGERERKENFLRGEESVAASFMRMVMYGKMND